ncbi:ankyrin repeat domain-containing protein 26 isoform X5 [Struthio camelus]|uniref:ankyrin repeat domain-containing protein 26 isoform X5 n=1 Tax=Struthio camelus TaxID=8801 RepID=UPI003603D6D3
MKRLFGFGRKRKGQPPSPSGSASLPCLPGAYELREKELGKLHRAAASGDLAQVRQGLKKCSVDGRDKAKRTPLHLACANGHSEVVMYLVENKCKLNLCDSDNRSPLMKAVQCQHEGCVAILLAHGADANLADANGNTALHLAALAPNTCLAGQLLAHNAHLDAQNKEGFTPLSLAVSEHHEEMVEFLLSKGADVHARDQSERTPLMTAASGGELNLIKVLLRYGADVSHKDINGWTAEDYAVIHGYSSVIQHLADYADEKNIGEAFAGSAKGAPVLSAPHKAGAAAFALGAPAADRGGMQQSPNQTSRTRETGKVIDDFSHGDSIRSSEESHDTWHTSEEEELDFTPKKPQKPNLTLLMNASQQLRKNKDGDGSRIGSPNLPKENLQQVTLPDTNFSKRECEELNQDVSGASNLEEEELEEEEEEEEEEDENDGGGDVEDYEEDEEEDLTQDEKEEEDLEDEEETQSNDIVEEEQGEKTEAKGEINQELGCFSNAKYEGEAQCGMGNVCDDHHKICKELDKKMEESDTPVSFIAGCYEKLQENVMAMSPPIMNNEISYKSVPEEVIFQSLNNLQDREENWKRKCAIQEDFHRHTDSCFADFEMADWKKETALPLSDSSGLKEKKSSFGDGFESGNNSWSEAENPRLENQRQNSVVLECVGAEEEQCEVDNKVCDTLEQESESFCLNSCEEKLRAAFPSSTKEESSEGEEKKKEDNGEENLQGAGVEGVKNFVCNDSLQLQNASEGHADVRSKYSEPAFHVLSSVEKKEALKDPIENYGRQVEEEKRKQRCFQRQAVAKQDDLGKLNILAGNVTNQQMKQRLPLKKTDCLRTESEEMIEEEKHKKAFSCKKRSKLIEMPSKSKSAPSAKGAKKNGNKKQTSKQKANQQMRSSSGIHFQVLDDSTFSETSQDEGRSATKRGSEKNKVRIQMDVTDLDLTQSSDTTMEDVELPTSAYKEAMLLIEQLSVDHTGSASLLKIQNILLEYEQIIEREKNRYTALWRELRKLESEKEESQLIAEETQDLKSILAHQEVEWKNDIQSLKFTLKQEEEKRLRVEMLYEKTREQLRKKEDHYCKEMEEKQQLELHSRNLEMELMTLRTLLKQVEEERDETQRQLSQEKSARALQEGILNSHLWRQKEIEEETRTIVKGSEVTENNEREKDLLYKNQLLQDEISVLRLEVDQVRLRSQEEEAKYLEENETLKEKNEDLKKELKLNEEALTQTVLQYNGQLNLLKTESAVLTSKLEQTKESKDRLETEIESFRSRLSSAVQELERHQASKSDVERTFQRERDEWLRLQEKLHHDLSDARETSKSLSQQLSKAESKASSLENELHQLKQTLREKTLLLEMTQKELSQAQCQAKECDHARQLEKDQVSKYMIKQESMQERLAQLQSENLLLRQQLEDMQNKGIIKEKVVSDVQDRFNDIFNKLRADTEKQVYLMEERNKELNAKCTDLREQVFKHEADKVEREGMVRQLQQELADALKKQSMSEASLEVTTRYRGDLEEDKLRLQKELDRVKAKLQELEEQHIQSERCVHDLKTALENKEREVIASSQKMQDLLEASLGTNTTIKQLEEHVQRLEIENARLEATAKQQTNRIEALQKELHASASVHNRLEDLITGLRTAPMPSEEDQNQQMQKQNLLSVIAKDSRSMWEEELKSRSQLEDRLAQLDREKAELLEQCETERKKVKKLIELKRPVEARLDQEMKRNIELQKECNRFKKLLKTVMKKLRVYEMRESESQFSSQGEMKNRYSEMVNEVSRLRTKVGELSQQLEIESKKSMQLEARNQDLGEELSSMRGNQEKLEKSKCQLKEEVSNLKRRLETNIVDHNQIEQYKKEIEDRAGQELRHKLQEVNLFLQTQAASQDRLEQIRASHHASLRNQLKQRIRDLESELDRIKNMQQDSIFQKESTQAEVGKYKELYLEEVKIRRCLANKLERANERLSEANAKLLHERHRSRSLIASSIVSGGGLSASPVVYSAQLGHLGNNLALNRSLSLGGSFMSSAGNALSSRNRVEAYVAKVRQELDEKITKELEQATAELETGSAGAPPMVSTDGSSKNVNADQDPLSRAIQEYRDVLTKNYLI